MDLIASDVTIGPLEPTHRDTATGVLLMTLIGHSTVSRLLLWDVAAAAAAGDRTVNNRRRLFSAASRLVVSREQIEPVSCIAMQKHSMSPC